MRRSWVVGVWYIGAVVVTIWTDSSGMSPAASTSLFTVMLGLHTAVVYTVRMCMHTHMHTHMHMHMHIQIHIHMHMHMHMQAYEQQPGHCADIHRDFTALWVHLVLAFCIHVFLVVLASHASRRGYMVSAMLASRRAEQLVIEKHKDREQMMALTFHEVRNPLNGTVGHLHLARHSLAAAAAPGAAAEALAEVDASLACTEMAMSFLTALSSLHSAVTGGMTTRPQPCDLSRVLATVAQVVRPQMQPGVELRLAVPTGPKFCVTDPIILQQILINLLQNAARFTQQGYVCLECVEEPPREVTPAAAALHNGAAGRRRGAEHKVPVGVAECASVRVTFAVKDTGTGLSTEVCETLFELYKTQGGLGLGLYLSRQLIRLLGSEVRVHIPYTPSHPYTPLQSASSAPRCASSRRGRRTARAAPPSASPWRWRSAAAPTIRSLPRPPRQPPPTSP